MEVSKLSLSKDYQNQESAKMVILKWLQDHPEQTRSTNCMQIAKCIAPTCSYTAGSLAHVVQKLVDVEALTKYGNKRRSNFYINYMHSLITDEMLAKAPEEDRKRVLERRAKLAENQHIDEKGNTVTTEMPLEGHESLSKATETIEMNNNTNEGNTIMNNALIDDVKFNELNENKIQKSLRNNELFQSLINKAILGNATEDINDATGMDLLKVSERWTIRKQFSLMEGKHYYKLYKEVFYVNNMHKFYTDTVLPTVYRRIAAQKESGDREWAENVSREMHISIVE